jgi:uncharacterized membrane protein
MTKNELIAVSVVTFVGTPILSIILSLIINASFKDLVYSSILSMIIISISIFSNYLNQRNNLS